MKYQRTNYLINPVFQLKTSLFISTLVLFLSLLYPLIIYSLFNERINLKELQISGVSEYQNELIFMLIGFQFIFFLIVLFICIFQAHKIAGPMYKLRLFFNDIANGKNIEPLRFRKNDHFQELPNAINNALTIIKNNHNKDFTFISEVVYYLQNIEPHLINEKKKVIHEIINKLNVIQSRYKSL